MPQKRNSKTYTKLLNEGPLSYAELPHSPNYEQRKDGVRKFNPSSSYRGSSAQGGGKKTLIYYIEGEHAKESVIKKWLKENQKAVEELSKRALHWRFADYGEEWKQTSREILGPFEAQTDDMKGATGGTCPLCGVEFSRALPDHLPECDER